MPIVLRRHCALFLLCIGAVLQAGCAIQTPGAPPSVAAGLARLGPSDVLLLGEQHDAPEHHAIEREVVEVLAQQGRLAALAIEMAEDGQVTTYLSDDATEAQVRRALDWNDKGWPWADYGPVVMAAVRAGVPVLGANLPRSRMKDAMADVSLDVQLGAAQREAQQQAVREGHCNLLPETQIVPMTRIQIARDRAMAHTVAQRRQPGKTVLLIAGAGHVSRTLGVPQHLPVDLRVVSLRLLAAASRGEPVAAEFDSTWLTPPLPEKDYCAALRK